MAKVILRSVNVHLFIILILTTWLRIVVAGELTAHRDFAFAEPYFESVGDSESLKDGIITALSQEDKGWLWIGTQHGVIRYDGYRFRHYQHSDADPGSIAGDYVTALWSGTDGRLWVGTLSDGLSIFDPKTEQFSYSGGAAQSEVPALTSFDGNVKGRIWALVGDARGGVWVGANQGLDYWPPEKGRPVQHFRHNAMHFGGLIDDRVRSLLIDHEGSLWIGTANGLQRRRAGSDSFERVASAPLDPASLAGHKVMTLFEATDGKLWIGTIARGAAWLDPQTQELHWLTPDPAKVNSLSHGWISKILQPRPGQIWLGTFGGGIDIVSARDGTLMQRIRHDPTNPNSLAHNHIGTLLMDASGLLWAGTWGGGLQRFQPANQAFQLLRHSPERSVGLSHSDVHSVLELHDGRILVGSDGNGIDIIDRKIGLIGGYRAFSGHAGELGDRTITALAQTPDGAIWAGTQQAGAFRLAHGSDKWEAYSTNPGVPDVINKFLVGRDGTLWVGTAGGLVSWLPQKKRFEAIAQADGSTVRAAVYNLTEDRQGRLWAGSDAGLWVWDEGPKTLSRILHDPQRTDSLASSLIVGLLSDHSGQLWVATANGLDCLKSWDGVRATFDHLNSKLGMRGNGLGDNMVEDKHGRIWTDTFVIDPKAMEVHELGKADGYDFGSGWTGSFTSTVDGLILRGGTLGVVVIDPEKFQVWHHQPQVVASELTIDGKSVSSSILSKGLTLAPGQRNFSIVAAALDFSAPQKNRYAFRLQGYDKDWSETDADHRSASYGNLWPGNYVLQVRGSNRLGVWSEHELRIPIRVLPAYWQTWWFSLISFVSFIVLILLGYRWRLRKVQDSALESAQLLEKLVLERTAQLDDKNRQLETLSLTDKLTGLHNRLKLDQTLEFEYNRHLFGDTKFSVILLDIDHFKSVNDSFGHQVGDMVLVLIAKLLKGAIREQDVIGRWGGEEFLVVCPGTSLEEACNVAERLRLAVAEYSFPVVVIKTSSFGVATIAIGETIGALVARADKALYRAKSNGRNRVEFEDSV